MSKQIKKFFSFIIAAAFTFCFYGNNLKTVSDEIKTLTAYATNATYGDATNDGVVDVFDLIIAREKLATEDSGALDLDGNDVINGVDLSLLNDFLLGSCDEFPVSIREQLKNVDYTVVDDTSAIEVSLTKEMAKFTESLGSPVKVYEYLYNNIDTSFYTNLRKGAIGVFEEKCGNDVDQASLLIAMLKHLGYNAYYYTQYIAVTEQQLLDWTGCQSIDAAKKVILTGGREVSEGPLYYDSEENYFYFNHTFVAVEIDSIYYGVDTSFKKYKRVTTAYDELDLKIDENIYKDFIDCNLVIEEPEIDEEWFNKLDKQSNYYMKSNIIEQKSFDELPLESEYIMLPQYNTYEAISDSISLDTQSSQLNNSRYIVSNNLKMETNPTSKNRAVNETFDYEMIDFSFGDGLMRVKTAYLYGKNVTVSYNQSSLKHELRFNDELILESKKISINDTIEFTVTAHTIGMEYSSTKTITAGEMISVVFDFERISPNIISYAYSDYLETTEESLRNADLLKNINESTKEAAIDVINNYENLGKLLRYIGVEMYSQAHIFNDYLSQMADIRNENGIVFSLISYQPTISQGKIEKQGNFSTNSAICNNAISRSGNEAARQSYNLIYGMYGSTLEKKAFEKILGIYCLSPIDILNEAQLQGTDLVTVNSFNKDELANLELNIHQSEINKILSYIDKGYNVTIPKNFVYVMDLSDNNYDDWGGIAYIATNPENGAGEYRWYGGYGYEGENTLTRGIDNSKKATGQLSVVWPFIKVINVITMVGLLCITTFFCYKLVENNSKNIDMPGSEIVDNVISSIDTMTESAGEAIKNAAYVVGAVEVAKATARKLRKNNEYYVYFGIKDEIPVYVGITVHVKIREYQHNYIWEKKLKEEGFESENLEDYKRFEYLEPLNEEAPLTRDEARGVEQVLIERNRDNFQNKLNSIGIFNKKYYPYTNFGKAYLETNDVYLKRKAEGVVN